MDVGLEAGADGIELAQKFTKQVPGLKIIIMSGNYGNKDRVEEAGFGSLLKKPFNEKELVPD